MASQQAKIERGERFNSFVERNKARFDLAHKIFFAVTNLVYWFTIMNLFYVHLHWNFLVAGLIAVPLALIPLVGSIVAGVAATLTWGLHPALSTLLYGFPIFVAMAPPYFVHFMTKELKNKKMHDFLGAQSAKQTEIDYRKYLE